MSASCRRRSIIAQSHETMRDELSAAIATLFAGTLNEPEGMTPAEIDPLDGVCGLAIQLRAHVGRHRHNRDIETVHNPEVPARLGLCLERPFVGLVAIGLSRAEAMRIIEGIALDSCPQNRREAFNLLDETAKPTREIAEAMNLPNQHRAPRARGHRSARSGRGGERQSQG